QCESDSLDLLQQVRGEALFKNQKHFENEWIKGTPDIVKPTLIDVKTSFDIWSFAKYDQKLAEDDYYYQGLAYMWLTGTIQAEFIFCLVNTPEDIIANEAYKAQFQFPEIGESDEAMASFRKNYIFDDIEAKDRVKSFIFEYKEDEIE